MSYFQKTPENRHPYVLTSHSGPSTDFLFLSACDLQISAEIIQDDNSVQYRLRYNQVLQLNPRNRLPAGQVLRFQEMALPLFPRFHRYLFHLQQAFCGHPHIFRD